MQEWTDKHYRHFMRLLTRRTRLYTEMIVDETLAFTTNPGRFLSFEDVQHPVAAQLGGNTPEKLAAAAALCQEWGFDEVNLNCGCPSNKVAVRSAQRRLFRVGLLTLLLYLVPVCRGRALGLR